MTKHTTVEKRTHSRRSTLKIIGAGSTAFAISGCAGEENGDDDVDQVEEPEGDPVRPLLMLSIAAGDAPARFEYGQLITDNIRELGVEVEYDAAPVTEYVDRIYSAPQDWDMFIRRGGDGFEPAEEILFRWWHSRNIGDGQGNVAGYENPEVDNLLEEQRVEVDPERRTELLHEIQEILHEDMVCVPNLIQERIMPYNNTRLQNPVSMAEDGLGNPWNFFEIEPTSESDGVLRSSMVEDIRKINPLDQISRGDREAVLITHDPLTRISTDISVEPWAAEEVNWTDDTTIEIRLREGMTFHDGEPVDADAVQFSYDYANEHSPWAAERLDAYDSIDVETDIDLAINLSEPSAPFSITSLSRIMIIPPHIWENIPEGVSAGTAMDHDNYDFVSSGPFQVVEADEEQMIIEAFEDHFSRPNVDRVVRPNVADATAAIRAFEDEALDMVTWELGPDDRSRLEQEEWVSTTSAMMTSIHVVMFNWNKPDTVNEPVSDPEFRRAVAHTVPTQDIISAIYAGMAEPINSFISSAFDEWYNDDLPPIDHDIDHARQILADAGYEWDTDGNLHLPPDM